MFSIDHMARVPIYEQIVDQIEKMILVGVLKESDQLPSIRQLSLELIVNPNTILKAFSDLDHRGILASVPGKGYFVCAGAKSILLKISRKKLEPFRQNVEKLALAGIPKSEIIALIDEVYDASSEIYLSERMEQQNDTSQTVDETV